MDTNATGRFIAERRKQKGYTQKELAEKINRSANTIWRYENNFQEPTLDTLRSFSAIFGVPLSFWESEVDDEPLTDSQRELLMLMKNNFLRMRELNEEQKALCYMELQKRLLEEFTSDV